MGDLRIVFVSNYLNHHQLPLCNAFLEMEQVEFLFVAVEPVSQARLELGYSDIDSKYDFVIRAYLSEREKLKAINEMKKADILISGENLRSYLSLKEQKGKLIFLYSERIFKKKEFNIEFIKNILRVVKNHTLNKNRNIYILCASAYVSTEFKKFRAYTGRMYAWGYFPEIYRKEEEEVKRLKKSKDIRILWVGRLIKYKQPQQALEIAKGLQKKGYCFRLDIVGSGELENVIKEQVHIEKLEERVNILGAKPVDMVRDYMDKANIFLFTSNAEEGWGAVLNEAMSSRCAVVANRCIGSVPFLLEHEKNGLIYDGTVEDLLAKTESLLKDRKKQIELGEQAYETMIAQWNAKTAAKNLIQLSKRLLAGEGYDEQLKGPCSYIG